MAAYAASDVPVNATKVDISTLPIQGGKCIYIIEQDGAYHLTGSNLRNGVRVPTQIQVAEGVHANLYLDHVDINNEDEQNTGTSQAGGVSTVPMNISGETVVYIVEASQMQSSSNHAVDINAKASLTVEEGEKLTVSSQGDYKAGIKVSGTLLVNGGEIQATGGDLAPGIGFTEATDGRIAINGGKVTAQGGWRGAGIGEGHVWGFSNRQIEIHGGEVCAEGGSWAAGIGRGDSGSVSSILIDGGTIYASGDQGGINAGDGKITVIKGGFIKEGTTIASGTKDNDETLTGTDGVSVTVLAGEIPDTTGQSVVAMSTYTVTDSVISNYKFYGTTDMKMSDTSRISAAIPADANRVDVTLLNDSGELDGYTMQVSGGVLAVLSEYQPYKVTYRVTENGQQVDTMTAYTDSQRTVQLPSGLPVYDYTFMQNGGIFDGTGVTSDITVDVERTKHPYTVTYTGDYTGTDTTEYGGSVVLPATNAGVYLFTDENGQEFKGTGIYKDREISVDHRWKYQILDADNQVWKEGLAESDDTVTLPEDTASRHYRYYDENGQEITGSSVGLTKDTVIRMTEETRSYPMTYTGAHNETKTLFYGDSVIPATGEATWIYVDAEGRQVDTYKGEPVIYVIDGGVTDEDGVSYYQIQNETDFQTFASYIQSGKSYLNGKLAADLSLGDYTPFSETYRGIFDGAGHTVTYHIGTEDNPVAAGEDNKGMSLFQCANGATFKNLSVDGT